MKTRLPCCVKFDYRDVSPNSWSQSSNTPINWTLFMWVIWAEEIEEIRLMVDLDDPIYPRLPDAARIVAAECIEQISARR